MRDLAALSYVEPEVEEGLLDVLVRRGKAVRETFSADCSGCRNSCHGAGGQKVLMIYRATFC